MILNQNCFAQSRNPSMEEFRWYPEKAIFSAYIEKNLENFYFRSPIEYLIVHQNNIIVKPFVGKISTIKTSSLDSNKVELIDIQKIFVRIDTISSEFRNYRYYLSNEKDKLLLEVDKKTTIDSIYFINNLYNFKFKSANETYPYLLISGKYKVSFINKEYLKSYYGNDEEAEFKLNGKVIGNSSIQGFKLLDLVRHNLSETYYLFDLEFIDNKNNKQFNPIAFKFFPPEKKWKGYKFNRINSSFEIEIHDQVIEMALLTR